MYRNISCTQLSREGIIKKNGECAILLTTFIMFYCSCWIALASINNTIAMNTLLQSSRVHDYRAVLVRKASLPSNISSWKVFFPNYNRRFDFVNCCVRLSGIFVLGWMLTVGLLSYLLLRWLCMNSDRIQLGIGVAQCSLDLFCLDMDLTERGISFKGGV
jgi:hypothetical protein